MLIRVSIMSRLFLRNPLIPVEDSEPVQEEIDLFLVLDDLIPPGVENADSKIKIIESEDLVFDPGISTFHFSLKPVLFALPKDEEIQGSSLAHVTRLPKTKALRGRHPMLFHFLFFFLGTDKAKILRKRLKPGKLEHGNGRAPKGGEEAIESPPPNPSQPSKSTLGKVTPLLASMLAQPTEDEGSPSERPSEAQPTPSPPHPSEATVDPQSDPSPRPSPSTTIPDSIPKTSGGNRGDQAKEIQHLKAQIKKLKKQAKPVITHHRAWMKSVSLKQRLAGKRSLKKTWMQKETRDVVDEEKENAEDVLSTEDVFSTDKEKVSTDRPIVSTDGSKVSTDKENDSTDRTNEGTDDQTEGGRATQTTQTTTSTIFGDDETIAQVLLNMSQTKAVLREKEKGVEFKDIEIDPKDKGKKKIEEEDESESESDGIPEAKKKFKQLASDEEMARKLQEDCEIEEERARLAKEEAINDALIRNYDDIKAIIKADRLLAETLQEEEREQFIEFSAQKTRKLRKTALYEKIKRSDEDFIAIGSAEDERMIKEMNEKGIDSSKNESVKEEGKEEEGTKKRKSGHIKMIARKKSRKQTDDDSDDEHRKCLKIVTFEATIDSEIMEKKSVITRLDKVSSPDGVYLVIYRANGNFRAFNYLMEVLHIFDRQDLFHLYELMMEQYSEITLEGFELILWGDLKIMMESSTEENDQSDFWSNQQEWKIITWRLYEACGVCILKAYKMDVKSIYSLRNRLMKSDTVNGMRQGFECWLNHHTTMRHQFTMLNRHKNWLVHKQTGLSPHSPSASVNTEPPKDVEELEIQPAEVTADSRESPKAGVFVVHLGSVAARIKERKCKTRGGFARPPVKRKLASGSSSSRAMRAKNFASKDDAPFLPISDDNEGLPDCFELKDASVCHLKIAAITLPAWKGHLDNKMDLELLDLHDRCYARHAAVDNVVNKSGHEFLQVIERMSGEADVIKARGRSRKEECKGLRVKCEADMAEFDQNPAVLALREKISSLTIDVKEHKGYVDRMMLERQKWASYQVTLVTLESKVNSLEADKARLEAVEASLRGEIEELNQDRRDVVSKVVPYVAMELVHSDELGRLVVKGYHSLYQKEHTQASNDFATATFPWLDEFIVDAVALIEALLSKKPPTLQKPAPSRTHMHVPSSQKATPSSAPSVNPITPPADLSKPSPPPLE
ncbi:hypothetical protein Tco_1363116 [Tanacetum coccineum]